VEFNDDQRKLISVMKMMPVGDEPEY